MNKVVLFLLAIVASLTVEAQINTPAPSPSAKIMQTVGLTEFTVDFSRPSMRGREVFGNLVPYGKLWRTGANAYSKITFDSSITVGETEVEAGTYSIFTKPSADSWEVYFYTDIIGGGTPSTWDESKIAAQVTVPVITMGSPIETFNFVFNDVKSSGANLAILWEKTMVSIPLGVPTDAAVMKNIDNALNGPSASDYFAAAVYYSSEGKDINKAKEWMGKAMEMTEKPMFWQLRQQSLILAKAGDKKGAIEVAKKSLAGAKEAGNDDYIKMNTESIKEWGAK